MKVMKFGRKKPFLRRKSQVKRKDLNLLRKARNSKSIFSLLLKNLVITVIQTTGIVSIMANAIILLNSAKISRV